MKKYLSIGIGVSVVAVFILGIGLWIGLGSSSKRKGNIETLSYSFNGTNISWSWKSQDIKSKNKPKYLYGTLGKYEIGNIVDPRTNYGFYVQENILNIKQQEASINWENGTSIVLGKQEGKGGDNKLVYLDITFSMGLTKVKDYLNDYYFYFNLNLTGTGNLAYITDYLTTELKAEMGKAIDPSNFNLMYYF